MQFDPENNIVILCAQGMQLEGKGKPVEAANQFQQAWNEATTTTEKFIAAHYVARHQPTVADKLKWDETAMDYALKIDNLEIKSAFPSLYLNIAKCYEDMNELDRAYDHYQLAFSFVSFLSDDGYGNMIKSGINKAIERVQLVRLNRTTAGERYNT